MSKTIKKKKNSQEGGKGKVDGNNQDPNNPHEHYTNKYVGAHNERRVIVLSVAMVTLLTVATVFGFSNYKSIQDTVARAYCRANPTDSRCEERRKIDPLDPRCEKHPDHRRCQPQDPVDPGDDPAPGEDPLPPTPPTDANQILSGTVNDPDGFTVPAGEVWVFDPAKDTTVEVEDNVIVYGVLEMRPNPGVTHTLRFKNVDESKFVGGGMELIDDDTGLWVLGNGILDIEGEDKVGWNRTGDDPTWKSSDELMVTPVNPGDYTVKSFTKGSTVPQLDSSVPKAEVFNLTRNVNIEGTPNGYSHLTMVSTQKQSIKYAAFRYMGIDTTVGRYPIHFHMMGDAARGSIVEGTVVRDSKEHAYVAHASHGVTFRDTVAYNITDAAYWWDPVKGTGTDTNATDDITFDHTLVAKVNNDESHPFSLCGYSLVAGSGGVVNDSVAAAVIGSKEAAGFCWPPNDLQVWEFHNNVAHNNPKNGIFVWHNDNTIHNINDFVAYSNDVGIDHGAYSNDYRYNDVYLYKNRVGIQLHAAGKANTVWQCVKERASLDGVFIEVLHSNASSINPVTFAGADYTGKIVDNAPNHTIAERVQFTDASCPYN